MNGRYLLSIDDPDQLPNLKNQIAFVGRSNVGKSSLINDIVQQKDLCRTSKTPGRTQKINYFEWGKVTLVDLPGYGFAKVPLAYRKMWDRLMQVYFDHNENLHKIYVLLDARRGVMDSDRHMIEMLWEYPYNIVLTKADEIKNVQSLVEEVQNDLKVIVYPTSTRTHFGVDKLRSTIPY